MKLDAKSLLYCLWNENTMTTIIVDDEPLARQLIKEYLHDFPQVKIIGECRNGRQAIKAINEHKPDLIFLDIRMPGIDGFEVLESLNYVPHVIFSTAYDDHACKAFEMNAVDYLLKPYDRKRFSRALQKVMIRTAESDIEIERVVRVLQQSRDPEDFPNRIFVRLGRKITSIQVNDIVSIESNGDYSKLHTSSGIHLCNLSLKSLEERMDPSRFLRVHRSHIIASNSIESLVSDGEGGFIATLRDKSKVKVSRTYAGKIRDNIW
jgi:two-component system, LytTR family, response regulator